MKNKNILIIEDDLILLNLLKQKLKIAGYNVFEERNGLSGIYAVEKLNPDLVLLDLILPEADGITVLKNIRENPAIKDTPVIIISNSGQPVEIEEVKKLGISDYLIKTEFDPQELVDKVNNFFGQKFSLDEKTEKEKIKNISYENQTIDYSTNNKIKIMIIEDDKFLRELISQKIVKEGMNVLNAITAEEALDILKKERPQIILLDLILPGISGFDFLKMIKSIPPLSDIPVIILSNLGEEKDRETAKNLGAKSFLVKAMHTPNEIVIEIKKVLNESYL